jgi:hypothetical protein
MGNQYFGAVHVSSIWHSVAKVHCILSSGTSPASVHGTIGVLNELPEGKPCSYYNPHIQTSCGLAGWCYTFFAAKGLRLGHKGLVFKGLMVIV